MKYYLSTLIPVSVVTASLILLDLLIPSDYVVPEEVDASNGVLLFSLIVGLILGSVVLIVLFTKMRKSAPRFFYGTLLGFSSVEIAIELVNISIILTFFLFTFSIIFMVIYIKGTPEVFFRNLGILISSVVIGRQVAFLFDLKSIVFASIFFIIFDILSVFKGPLSKVLGAPKKIVYSEPSDVDIERGIIKTCIDGTPVYISKYSYLGIGDTMFFGLLIQKALITWGLISVFPMFLLIYSGSVITLILLRHISPLPALPIPVFFALIGYLFLFLVYS